MISNVNPIMTIAKRFGHRLKAWRNHQELPIKHVAGDLGVSIQVVSDWERGVRFPCEKHLAKLEDYTGLPLCVFFLKEEQDFHCSSGLGDCAQGGVRKARKNTSESAFLGRCVSGLIIPKANSHQVSSERKKQQRSKIPRSLVGESQDVPIKRGQSVFER